MGTTFEELYEDWMLPVINNYKLDKLYSTNKEALFEYLRVFLRNGLSDFQCIKPLTYHTEEIYAETTEEIPPTEEPTTVDDLDLEETETDTENPSENEEEANEPTVIGVRYVFDCELDDEEKKIVSEIAVANYWKRQVLDIKARMPYMQQREFKKDALAPIMKQNEAWYKDLVSEYMGDINNYQMRHIEELPFWKDFA